MHSSRLPFLSLLLALAAAALSAQPFPISEPAPQESLVATARLASDGAEFLTVWQPPSRAGELFATPLDRFGAARGPAKPVATSAAHTNFGLRIGTLLWADSRYLLIYWRDSKLEVAEIDRDANVVERWSPTDFGPNFDQAFWVDGGLYLTQFSGRVAVLDQIRPDGSIRRVGSTTDYERLAPGHGGWYGLGTAPLRLRHYSPDLELQREAMIDEKYRPASLSPLMIAPAEDGSVLFAWSESAQVNQHLSVHFGSISESGEVTLGAVLTSRCYSRLEFAGFSGSRANVLINRSACGESLLLGIETRTAVVVTSQDIPFLEFFGAAGAADRAGFALQPRSNGRRLATFLLADTATLHYPARQNPVVPAVAIDSWEGRTTAAWIEKSGTLDRLLVRRIFPGTAGRWLMSRDLAPDSGTVQVTSSPEVDLILWRSGDQLFGMRLDLNGDPLDDQPFLVGRAGWAIPPAAAWNGSRFLVVWGQRPLVGNFRVLASAWIEEHGAVHPMGILKIERPFQGGFVFESPSLAWNGEEFLLSFHISRGGCVILCPPAPRELFVHRLDESGRILEEIPVRVPGAYVPPLRTGGLDHTADVWPSVVASDGGEFVIAHPTDAGPQLIRIRTSSGQPEVTSIERLVPWGRQAGQVSIEAGSYGYSVATTVPTESGTWLVLDSLDPEGNLTSRFSHRIGAAAHVDVTSHFGMPLAIVGGFLEDENLAFAASPAGAVPLPAAPPSPNARMTTWGGGLLQVEWDAVEGARGYIITKYYPSPLENHSGAIRTWVAGGATRAVVGGLPEWRVTVQTVGPDGASPEAEAVFIPHHRRRIVGR